MKNHYSQTSLNQFIYDSLLGHSKDYSQLLVNQIAYAPTRLQSVANCWRHPHSQLLTNTHKSDCKEVIFDQRNFTVCNIANLVFIRSHPP